MSHNPMEQAIVSLLIIGLAVFSIGLILWIVGLLQRYSLPFEIQLVAIGIILILLSSLAAKLLSRD